ncbi:MAG: alpha/beta hydrolase [Azospirillaceae bacterium]
MDSVDDGSGSAHGFASDYATPARRVLPCLGARGFHRTVYWEYGSRPAQGGRPDTVCVHGLTRQGRDFDALAADLARDRRVACPDIVGRGASDWLADPSEYGYPRYVGDMATLIARLDTDSVDWVGTSMGGLIGLFLAATPGNPIRRLVLNDIGPFLPAAAVGAIVDGLGEKTFADIDALEAHLRESSAGFGPLTDAQWRHLARVSSEIRPDGTVARNYDPAIAEPLRAAPVEDVDLWAYWDAVRCPVLVIRGAESPLLTEAIVAEMRRRGPDAEVVTVPGTGHAPMLMAPDQIAAVRGFLDA